MNYIISDLKHDINNLIKWLSENYKLPTYSGVKVVVDSGDNVELDAELRVPINKSELFSLEEYCDEYKRKKRSGYSWVNLNCAGILDKELIIVIEYPKKSSSSTTTSINFSGPNNRVLSDSSEWDFNLSYKIIF
jgi:hypothetical protein